MSGLYFIFSEFLNVKNGSKIQSIPGILWVTHTYFKNDEIKKIIILKLLKSSAVKINWHSSWHFKGSSGYKWISKLCLSVKLNYHYERVQLKFRMFAKFLRNLDLPKLCYKTHRAEKRLLRHIIGPAILTGVGKKECVSSQNSYNSILVVLWMHTQFFVKVPS